MLGNTRNGKSVVVQHSHESRQTNLAGTVWLPTSISCRDKKHGRALNESAVVIREGGAYDNLPNTVCQRASFTRVLKLPRPFVIHGNVSS